jgi:hypothetical protein
MMKACSVELSYLVNCLVPILTFLNLDRAAVKVGSHVVVDVNLDRARSRLGHICIVVGEQVLLILIIGDRILAVEIPDAGAHVTILIVPRLVHIPGRIKAV